MAGKRRKGVDTASAESPAPVALVPDASGMAEVCHGCGYLRPLEEFTCQALPERMGNFDLLCEQCRTVGVPEQPPIEWTELAPKHRHLLKAIFEEQKSYAVAAAEVGIHPKQGLARLLAANVTVRRAYMQLLVRSGLDLMYLTQKLRVQLNARKPFYDPAINRTYWIPDNAAIGRALDLLAKSHDVMPKEDKPREERPTTYFVTNIFGPMPESKPGEELVRNGPMVLDVTPEPAP